jgi:hypothetical protein
LDAETTRSGPDEDVGLAGGGLPDEHAASVQRVSAPPAAAAAHRRAVLSMVSPRYPEGLRAGRERAG